MDNQPSDQRVQQQQQQFCKIFVGIVNLITLIVSIGLISWCLWRRITNEATTCERLLEKLVIPFGIFLLVVSLIGLIGAFSPISWILEFYLILMFLLMAFIISIYFYANFAGYKGVEPWLQKKINNKNNWNIIKCSLQPRQFCSESHSKFLDDYLIWQDLSDVQVRIFYSLLNE